MISRVVFCRATRINEILGGENHGRKRNSRSLSTKRDLSSQKIEILFIPLKPRRTMFFQFFYVIQSGLHLSYRSCESLDPFSLLFLCFAPICYLALKSFNFEWPKIGIPFGGKCEIMKKRNPKNCFSFFYFFMSQGFKKRILSLVGRIWVWVPTLWIFSPPFSLQKNSHFWFTQSWRISILNITLDSKKFENLENTISYILVWFSENLGQE